MKDLSKRVPKTKIELLAEDIERAESKLKRLLKTDYVKAVTIDDKIFYKSEMAYAVAILKRKAMGRVRKDFTVCLVRFNLRTLRIQSVVPIEKEVVDSIFNSIREAWKVAEEKKRRLIEIEERRKLLKILETLSPQERELLIKVLREELGEKI